MLPPIVICSSVGVGPDGITGITGSSVGKSGGTITGGSGGITFTGSAGSIYLVLVSVPDALSLIACFSSSLKLFQ